jgi:K+-sensing histidine kinase KdpD/DNA-binding winged helix-turn-helix (wHTH) protein
MWFLWACRKESSGKTPQNLDERRGKAHLTGMENAELTIAPGRQETAVDIVRPYAETLVMVAASTLVGMLVAPRWGNSPVDLLYLPAVLAAAGFHGLWPGLTAAVASALAFNFYFTQPYHTLRISKPEDVATVALLFLVALVTSQLAARMQAERQSARKSAARNATVAGFARRLLSSSRVDQIALVACRELSRLFECNAVMMSGQAEPVPIAATPAHSILTPSDIAAAAWAIESREPAGRGTRSVIVTEWVFYPIRSESAVLGAIGLARDDGGRPVPLDQLELLANLIDQVALALERARLEVEAQDFARTREGDRVRSVLLSSIGQDLEPRLAAMSSAARALQRSGTGDKSQVAAIGSEVTKLQRYLSNLLELGPEADQEPVNAGNVTIDLFRRTVSRDGEPVHLAPKEYGVLAELAKHPGRVLTHAHLLRSVWGPAQERQIEYLRVAIRGLRQKLEADPAHPVIILNEPAVGYRLAG